jgi:hypothetical protein
VAWFRKVEHTTFCDLTFGDLVCSQGTYEVDELLKFLTDAVPEVQRQKKTTTRETTPKEGVNAVKTEL